MIECSGIFSKEIAVDCTESGFAAARTMLSPLHQSADADALVRANEEGTASQAKAANPRSYQQIKQRRGSLLCESGRLDTPISCAIQEPWNLSHVRNTAETRRGRTGGAGDEFVATDRLLARLTLRQVRRHHVIADAVKQGCSSLAPYVSDLSVSMPNVGAPVTLRSGLTVRTFHPTSPNTPYTPIETLLAELARRRLLSFVAKEDF
jgi:hypothetical protein